MNIPERLTNKFNQFVRIVLVIGGIFASLGAFAGYANGNAGGVIVFGGIALGAFWSAAKIKVHYHLRGGVAVYE